MIRALPVLALCIAAIDTFFARQANGHRPVEAGLFFQTAILWVVFGLIALPFAWVLAKFLKRLAKIGEDESDGGAGIAALATVMVFPVLAHGRLDQFTSLGQDISGLMTPRPWLEVFAVVVVLLVAARLLVRPLSSALAKPLGVVLIIVSTVSGIFLPGSFSSKPSGPSDTGQAAAGSPNLLLLVWDTTRSKSLSAYGYDRETTPKLAEFAQKSTLFEESRSVSCFTLTSHLSMLTGTYPSHHGARMTKMIIDPRATPTIASVLQGAGYRTGGFVGTGVLRANTGIVAGFDAYDDQVDPPVCDSAAWSLLHDVQSVLAKVSPIFNQNGRPHWLQDFQRPAPEVLGNALEWIEDEDDPRPWFCFINLYDVHWPYLPEGEGAERFVSEYDGLVDGFVFRSDSYHRPPKTKQGSRLTDEDWTHLTELYDGEMFELDRVVDEFLSELDLDGGETAVLLTSDHGEAFGEAGLFEHDDIYEPQVRVPLMLYAPGVSAPGPVSGRTTGVDVGRTILGLAGVAAPEHMRGMDLAHEAPGADRLILVEDRDKLDIKHTHYAVYREHWKLVRTGVGETAKVALYDLRTDLVGELDVGDQHADVRTRLLAELTAERATWGGDKEVWKAADRVSAPHLGALGYTGEGSESDEDEEEDH